MALHVATDIFSHSTFNLDGERIKHEYTYSEDVKDAHNTDLCKNRYVCAKQISQKLLESVPKTGIGDCSDFKLSQYNTGSNKNLCFKLKNVKKYIKEMNSTYYTKNKTYFDKMDVEALN